MISNIRLSQQVEYGDYQTPQWFTLSVCEVLKKKYSLTPTVVLEPTFGTGNFIPHIISTFQPIRAFYGIEINALYYKRTQELFSNRNDFYLYHADIFTFDFNEIKRDLTSKDNLLIIGNPPWVTNTQLCTMGSSNLPRKKNIKGYSGLDAKTGKGNFDIAEYIILHLLSEFSAYNCTLAMLCKTIVGRNIFRDKQKYNLSISQADMFIFESSKVFNISCDAALLVLQLGKETSNIGNVFDFYTGEKLRQFGWQDGHFYADIPNMTEHSDIDGNCQYEWRQGIKHDCSRVMELKKVENGLFVNGLDEQMQFTIGEYIFPLIKSSDIKSFEICSTRKYVIVPQRQVNAETSSIAYNDETVWQYLVSHAGLLNARKSLIYKKSPKFAIFGIGNYSFAPYKVGISGFYKEPVFALIHNDYPVMLDDTCYFLSFSDITEAVIITGLLNSKVCISFLSTIAFLDSKRPYTKEVLKRIDFAKLANVVSFEYISEFAQNLFGGYNITSEQYSDFKRQLLRKAPNSLFSETLCFFNANI